jgi:hypothetical protein
MRKGLIILLGGLAMFGFAWFATYQAGTFSLRQADRDRNPELLWLQQEFRLGASEYGRIRELHDAYLPACRLRCQAIHEVSTRIRRELSRQAKVTPAVEQLLLERGRLIADCQLEMLRHFQAVSESMPPAQGRRYLTWVMEHTCLRDPMSGGPEAAAMQASHHVP